MDAREHPPQCHGNSEAKELYNSLFIGTLEKHPRFSLHCYTNPVPSSLICREKMQELIDHRSYHTLLFHALPPLGAEVSAKRWVFKAVLGHSLRL